MSVKKAARNAVYREGSAPCRHAHAAIRTLNINFCTHAAIVLGEQIRPHVVLRNIHIIILQPIFNFAVSLQTQLSDMLRTKQRCKQPVFRNCCQVL